MFLICSILPDPECNIGPCPHTVPVLDCSADRAPYLTAALLHAEPQQVTITASQLATAPAAGAAPQPAAAAKPTVVKRRVATIGSKPQLNPEAVAAAARAAEVCTARGT